MIIQQVEVKRYDSFGQFLYSYNDEVVINPDAPVYPDLKTQLKAERWNTNLPSESKLDERLVPSLFENKVLTRRR
jgi:hypothetical protein